MKKLLTLTALAAMAVATTSASAAVISFSGNWTNSINNNISGGPGITSQDSSTTVTSTVTVQILDLSTLAPGVTVTGIEIIYTAPRSPNSPDITATTTVSSGTSTFTNLLASARTNITSTDVAGYLGDPYDLNFNNPYSSIDSETGAPPNIDVSSGSPWAVTLTRVFDVKRLNQPANATVANLLTSNGTTEFVDFTVDTVLRSQFTRTATGGEVNASFIGTDSGTITINYYTIPEPTSAALAGLGVLGLMVRRRRA